MTVLPSGSIDADFFTGLLKGNPQLVEKVFLNWKSCSTPFMSLLKTTIHGVVHKSHVETHPCTISTTLSGGQRKWLSVSTHRNATNTLSIYVVMFDCLLQRRIGCKCFPRLTISVYAFHHYFHTYSRKQTLPVFQVAITYPAHSLS